MSGSSRSQEAQRGRIVGWLDRIKNLLRPVTSGKGAQGPPAHPAVGAPHSRLPPPPAPRKPVPYVQPTPVVREVAPSPSLPGSRRSDESMRTKATAYRAAGRVPVQPWSTQFNPLPHRQHADLVIGLDFGTSCSKVVIRSPFMFGARAVAVHFGALGHASSRYLLPTKLFHLPDDRLSLTNDDAFENLTDMKVLMMKHPNDADVAAFAAGYLAHVIRLSRQWFLETQSEGYGGYELRWSFNLGIPSAGYDDASIREAFRRVAKVAWQLSIEETDIQWSRARAITEREIAAGFDAGIEIDVIPEVAAEVVGYARSPLRVPGLHILVDVGASTLDICSFILHDREGQDRYALPTALVEQLGVIHLHQRRLAVLDGGPCAPIVQAMDVSDPLAIIPATAVEYAEPGRGLRERLAAVDQHHADECRRALMRTIVDLKTRREPNSKRWSEGLPIFLCGGGSRMNCFQQVINDADERMVALSIGAGILVRKLPRPEDLKDEDVSEDVFDRLAVAYGLSFDALDIGTIVPPSEIEDVPDRAPNDWESRFVSKEQV